MTELAASDLSDADVLPTLTRLRNHYPADKARAAVEQTLLRRRARLKFPYADMLYLTRDALEQASSAAVATYRARHFAPYEHVADVCCGIGGDMLALAQAGHRVTAIDQDAVRLALAQANAEVLGLDTRITFVQADVLTTPLPSTDAIFCDPGRRSGGRRRFSTEQYEPPLSHVLTWHNQTAALAVKLAPGINIDELSAHAPEPYTLEFISLDGDLKEATIHCGTLAQVGRRATLLKRHRHPQHPPPDHSITDQIHVYTLTDEPHSPAPPVEPPAGILYEPDPAIIRAGLVAHLAAHLGAAQLDPDIAYLTAPDLIVTPFARAWRIYEWHPFQLKHLRARLRQMDAGSVTVKKRGSPLDTDALAHKLSGGGTRALVVVLTHVQGKPAALICSEVCTE